MSTKPVHGRRSMHAPVVPLPITPAPVVSFPLAPVLTRRESLLAERSTPAVSEPATQAVRQHNQRGRRSTKRASFAASFVKPSGPAPARTARQAVGATQRVAILMAVAGLTMAVVAAPNTGEDNVAATASSAAEPLISAPSSANLSFVGVGVTSALTLDGKLRQTLAVSAAKVTAAAAKGTLSAPMDTLNPSSGFGPRINPLTGAAGEFHTGQDFAAACGSPVKVAAGGTVTFSGWHPYGGGNRIVVDHGNGLSTSYNHLSSLGVHVGQKVERGDVIAASGTTGASTGCHLHFEVMVNGQTVDPLGWL